MNSIKNLFTAAQSTAASGVLGSLMAINIYGFYHYFIAKTAFENFDMFVAGVQKPMFYTALGFAFIAVIGRLKRLDMPVSTATGAAATFGAALYLLQQQDMLQTLSGLNF